MPNSSAPVQSIDRVFDIIEALSTCAHGMSLSDLAAEVQLHVSTTHRLLSSLSARGYVQKDFETGKYRLTTRMFEVGSRIISGMNLLSASRPYLEQLASSTNETIHLVARQGDEVVYLFKEDTSNSVIRMASSVGLRSPMYCTAVGKSILAHLPESEVQNIWNRTEIKAFTPTTLTRYEDLSQQLREIRKLGYAVDRSEHELGVMCVAAPILDFTSSPIGAISVSAPDTRITEEKLHQIAQLIVRYTNQISTFLGASVPQSNI